MTNLKFLLAASIAAALALSCTDNSDSENEDEGKIQTSSMEGIQVTEVYTLEKEDENYFDLSEERPNYTCKEGGILEENLETYAKMIYYSISNNTMIWQQFLWHLTEFDTLNFKGTSNDLTGTWTRTKNKAASCEYNYLYEQYICKEDWDIIKAVFTDNTASITRETCPTDEVNSGEDDDGWKVRIIDCFTYEIYKGKDKITMMITVNDNVTEMNLEANYKGKSCKMSVSNPSKARMETLCKEAWDYYEDEDYYSTLLYNEIYGGLNSYQNCLRNIMQKDLAQNYKGEFFSAQPLQKSILKLLRTSL